MKTLVRTFVLAAFGALLLTGCLGNRNDGVDYTVYPITVDREAIRDVAANNPGDEVIIVKTDAPYWLVTTNATWITPDLSYATGNGKSTILSLKIESNYKNENTTTQPRTGEVKISGGHNSILISVSQLGFEGIPATSIGGIPDMDEFKDFIAAVNDGLDLERWTNDAGEIELKTDLDLSGFDEWTPIGLVSSTGNNTNACKPQGATFTGIFNGGGHSITGFKATEIVAANKTWGLFGCIDGGTVKNLNLTDVDITLSATGAADAGILVGTLKNGTVENVTLTGKLDLKGSSTTARFAVGGIAGFIASQKKEDQTEDAPVNTLVKDCTVTLTVTGDRGNNTGNGATGCQFGSVVGFATNVDKDASLVKIEGCVANGSITTNWGRSSGIVAAANYATLIESCTNNADQVNSFSGGSGGRIANITCILGQNGGITDCVNNGSVTTTANNCQSGGFVCLLNHASAYIKGGANYGDIITAFDPSTDSQGRNFRGLLVANFSAFDEVDGVTVSGRVGKYVDGGTPQWLDVNAENFIDGKYIGHYTDGNKAKIKNLTYVAP